MIHQPVVAADEREGEDDDPLDAFMAGIQVTPSACYGNAVVID